MPHATAKEIRTRHIHTRHTQECTLYLRQHAELTIANLICPQPTMESLATAMNAETVVVDLRSYTVSMISSPKCNDGDIQVLDQSQSVEVQKQVGKIATQNADGQGSLPSKKSASETRRTQNPCDQQEKMNLEEEEEAYGVRLGNKTSARVALFSEENHKEDDRLTAPTQIEEPGIAKDKWNEIEEIPTTQKTVEHEKFLNEAEATSNAARMAGDSCLEDKSSSRKKATEKVFNDNNETSKEACIDAENLKVEEEHAEAETAGEVNIECNMSSKDDNITTADRKEEQHAEAGFTDETVNKMERMLIEENTVAKTEKSFEESEENQNKEELVVARSRILEHSCIEIEQVSITQIYTEKVFVESNQSSKVADIYKSRIKEEECPKARLTVETFQEMLQVTVVENTTEVAKSVREIEEYQVEAETLAAQTQAKEECFETRPLEEVSTEIAFSLAEKNTEEPLLNASTSSKGDSIDGAEQKDGKCATTGFTDDSFQEMVKVENNTEAEEYVTEVEENHEEVETLAGQIPAVEIEHPFFVAEKKAADSYFDSKDSSQKKCIVEVELKKEDHAKSRLNDETIYEIEQTTIADKSSKAKKSSEEVLEDQKKGHLVASQKQADDVVCEVRIVEDRCIEAEQLSVVERHTKESNIEATNSSKETDICVANLKENSFVETRFNDEAFMETGQIFVSDNTAEDKKSFQEGEFEESEKGKNYIAAKKSGNNEDSNDMMNEKERVDEARICEEKNKTMEECIITEKTLEEVANVSENEHEEAVNSAKLIEMMRISVAENADVIEKTDDDKKLMEAQALEQDDVASERYCETSQAKIFNFAGNEARVRGAHSARLKAEQSNLHMQKCNDSHLDHLKADERALCLKQQNGSPHFVQSTVAAAVAIEEASKRGNLNKLKEKEAHVTFQKAKATRAKDIHLEAKKNKAEHAKNDTIATLIAEVELMQKKDKVAHNRGKEGNTVHTDSKLLGANADIFKVADKEKERRTRLEKKILKVISPSLTRKSFSSNRSTHATEMEVDILHSKPKTWRLDVKPVSPYNQSLLTPKSQEKNRQATMNKSIKSMEKEILKAVLPPRKRLSLPNARHRVQLLTTPPALTKKRPAYSAGAKPKLKSYVGLCDRKWNSRCVSSPQPCERCLKIHTTTRVRKEFEMNILATSPCVNKTRGGCSPNCGYFPRNILEGERPVVLCRHCFYALHRNVQP